MLTDLHHKMVELVKVYADRIELVMSEQHKEQPEPSRKEVLVIYGKRTRSLWFNKDDDLKLN